MITHFGGSVKHHGPYDEAAWQAEMALVKAGVRLACLDCGSDADYSPKSAPRPDGSERQYRACKMCGFWQEADGTAAYRCWKSEHVCVRDVVGSFTCEYCGGVLVGPVAHRCGKYLLPSDSGYDCTTCGHWYGRESHVPWRLPGSG